MVLWFVLCVFGKVANVSKMCVCVCVFFFGGVAYSCLFGFGRFRVRWGAKGPTSSNHCFLWCFCFSCVLVVFLLFLLCFVWECFWCCSLFFFGGGVSLLCFFGVCFCFVLCVGWSGLGVVLVLFLLVCFVCVCLFVFVFFLYRVKIIVFPTILMFWV